MRSIAASRSNAHATPLPPGDATQTCHHFTRRHGDSGQVDGALPAERIGVQIETVDQAIDGAARRQQPQPRLGCHRTDSVLAIQGFADDAAGE